MAQQTANSGKNAFTRGADWFAIALAVAGAFFCVPAVFRASKGVVVEHALAEIGPGWDWLIGVLWAVVCAIGTFGFLQMAIAVSLRLALAKLASILFGR